MLIFTVLFLYKELIIILFKDLYNNIISIHVSNLYKFLTLKEVLATIFNSQKPDTFSRISMLNCRQNYVINVQQLIVYGSLTFSARSVFIFCRSSDLVIQILTLILINVFKIMANLLCMHKFDI